MEREREKEDSQFLQQTVPDWLLVTILVSVLISNLNDVSQCSTLSGPQCHDLFMRSKVDWMVLVLTQDYNHPTRFKSQNQTDRMQTFSRPPLP